MALLELTLVSSYFGQECVNRFNYLSGGTPASVSLSYALISAFGAIYEPLAIPPGYPPGTPMAAISEILSTSASFSNILAKDIYSVTDFYDTAFVPAYAGTRTGEGMSPAMATGFSTNRVRSDVRRGQKRFVGVSENVVDAGGEFSGAILPTLNACAAALSDVLEYDDEGNTLTFTPVVCGKMEYVVPGSSPARKAYKYWPDLTQQLDHTAAGVVWSVKPFVRTQTSRQYGRGR